MVAAAVEIVTHQLHRGHREVGARGGLFVGSPETVAHKIADSRWAGWGRRCLVSGVRPGPLQLAQQGFGDDQLELAGQPSGEQLRRASTPGEQGRDEDVDIE